MMSSLRVVLVVAATCLTATTAAAQPATRDGRGGYAQLSVGVAIGWLDRTATYHDTDGGEPDSVDPLSGRGGGAALAITGGFDLGNGVRLGGFVRTGAIRMELATDPARAAIATNVWAAILGPTITLREPHGLYLRGDAGIGSIIGSISGAYGLATRPLDTLQLGAEVGYERVVAPGWRAQLGLAVAATWGEGGEEADRGGYYTDHARVVTAALVLSIARGP